MPSAATILVPASAVLFSVFAAHAFALRREQNYREFWGASSWALLPALTSAIWLGSDPEVSVTVRNIAAGLFGAVFGASAAIWSGYLLGSYRAVAQNRPTGEVTMPEPSQPGAAVNGPNNQGIVTNNQSGGTNNLTINREDNSPGRRMRDLFDRIDPNIIGNVEQGRTHIAVWMQPFEINKLRALIAEAGTASDVTIDGLGRRDIDSQISNGDLGRARPVHEKIETVLTVRTNILPDVATR
jgi:hypothetical protein